MGPPAPSAALRTIRKFARSRTAADVISTARSLPVPAPTRLLPLPRRFGFLWVALALWSLILATDVLGQDSPDLQETIRRQEQLIVEQAQGLVELRERVRVLEDQAASRPALQLDEAIAELGRRLDAAIEAKIRGARSAADSPFGRPTNESLRWGGYSTIAFLDRQETNSTFSSIRLVPQLEADVSDWLVFGTEIEFEHGGAGAGFLDDAEILVEYAELRAQVEKELNFKAGILLIPFLSYNSRHDDPLHEFTDRPYTARNLVPTAFGQPGIGAYGAIDVCDLGSVNYDVTLTNGFDDGFDSEKGARGARSPFNEDNNGNKTFTGRLGAVPHAPFFDVVDLGGSFLVGTYDAEGKRAIRGYGVDVFVRKGPFDLRGEWGAFELERRNSLLVPDDRVAFDPKLEIDHPTGLRGWYVEGAWRFFPFPEEWRSRKPFSSESEFALAVRVQGMDLNTAVRGATPTDDRNATAIALSFRPSAKTVIRVAYEWVRSAFDGPGTRQNSLTASISTYF